MARLEIPLREDEFSEASMELQIQSLATSILQLRQDLATHSHQALGIAGGGVADRVNIDLLAKTIVDEFTFSQSGALQIGEYVNGVSGDIRISPNGIVARNTAGVNSFVLDGTIGSAAFAGTLVAASGTLGTLTVASGGNIKMGQTAYDTGIGFWLGDVSGTVKFSMGNSAGNKYLWDGTTADFIGCRIRTANVGTARLEIFSVDEGQLVYYTSADKGVVSISNSSDNLGGKIFFEIYKLDATNTLGFGLFRLDANIATLAPTSSNTLLGSNEAWGSSSWKLYTHEIVVPDYPEAGAPTPNSKIKIKINGAYYYLSAQEI